MIRRGPLSVALVVAPLFSVILTSAVCMATAAEPPIRVGSEVDFPPFAALDAHGKATGFSVDLIRAVADAAGLRVDITTGPWDEMWNGLVAGRFDVLPLVAKMPGRESLVDFSLSHTQTFDAFFVREGDPAIKDISAAEGKKVVVMRSDAAHHALLERKFRGEMTFVDTISEGLKIVASGRHDAFLCSKLIGTLAMRQHGIRGLAAGPLIPEYKRTFVFGVRKGADELREKLNEGLLIVKSNGEYERIYDKWLGFDDPWRKYRKYYVSAFIGLLAIALALVALAATLRMMVRKRTSDLSLKNEALVREISTRERVEDELRSHKEKQEMLLEERTRDLRDLSARYEAILGGIPDIVMEVDNVKVYTWSNAAGRDFFGDDVIGKEASHYFEGEQDTYVKMQPLFDGEENTFYVESWQRRKDGERRLLAWWCRALKDTDGRVTGALSTARDITGQVLDRKEKEALQSQLQHAMKMEAVGRLAGGVAHDFNNLLTAIIGNVSLGLIKLSPSDPVSGLLKEVNKAAERAARLTQQLLAFSRRQIIEPKLVNLNDLITDLHAMLVRLIGENMDLETVPGVGLGAVNVDRGQFEQILVNLVLNARDAMPGGGKILIQTLNVELDEEYCATHAYIRPGRFVMLEVSDRGHGMTDEVKSHLFEPFFTTKPKGGGTGLGLATTYGVVKQSDGSIEVHSEVGEGTTVRIYLPRVDGCASEPEKAGVPGEQPTGNELALLVEDEEMVRNMCLNVLEQLGYRVLQAKSGEEAIAVARGFEGRIDLLLTDVVMPGMNGFQLAERLAPIHPEAKVLFMSGYTEDAIMNHGVLDKGVSFIGKPYSLSELAGKIREVLDKA